LIPQPSQAVFQVFQSFETGVVLPQFQIDESCCKTEGAEEGKSLPASFLSSLLHLLGSMRDRGLGKCPPTLKALAKSPTFTSISAKPLIPMLFLGDILNAMSRRSFPRSIFPAPLTVVCFVSVTHTLLTANAFSDVEVVDVACKLAEGLFLAEGIHQSVDLRKEAPTEKIYIFVVNPAVGDHENSSSMEPLHEGPDGVAPGSLPRFQTGTCLSTDF
jgi:hypothetical protein